MTLRPKGALRRTRTRWVLRGGLAVSLASSAALMGFSASAAHADSPLLAYTAQADANTVDIVVDTAAGLAGFHPLTQADIPENSSDYETGPTGRSFASFLWPGAAAGNLGSLAGAFGAPDQLAPLADKLNDPVRAEATYPAGNGDVTYPSGGATPVAEMHAHADANKTTATAAFSDLTSPLFNVQGVQGATEGTATSAAKATSSGSFSGFSLLGGLVTVGATSSTASATSDGKVPKASSTTHIGALTVGGYQASVGSDGLVLGPATATGLGALLGPTQDQVNNLIKLLNLQITTLPEVKKTDVPAASVTSGALQITFQLPSQLNLNVDCGALKNLPQQLQTVTILCTLPGLLTGATITFTLGRVTAQAVASPPFDDDLSGPAPSTTAPSSTTPASTGSTPVTPVDNSGGGGGGTIPGGVTSPGDVTTPTEAAPPQVASEPPVTGLPEEKVALSKPVSGGVLFGLLLLAALCGGLLLWTSALLDGAPATSCPLEDPQ